MFGAKARRIKNLEVELQGMMKMRDTSRKFEAGLRETIAGLTADRDLARDSLAALAAERDQFAKRIEELENGVPDSA